MNNTQSDDQQKIKENRNMTFFLLILPIGIMGFVWLWSRLGFVYALLYAALYFPLGILKVFSKK